MSASVPADKHKRPHGLDSRRTAAISRGFEALLANQADLERMPEGEAHFDVVIVGSGYGGAVAAAELAGCTDNEGKRIKVCVLERGSEYLPGMFPSRLAELPSHVRFSTPESSQARGDRTGLFDIRVGGDVNALVANGLGGGSLINAGVMAVPDYTVFERPQWPETLRDPAERTRWYDKAKKRLGARIEAKGGDAENTLEDEPVKKVGVLEKLARGGAGGAVFKWAPLSTLLRHQGVKQPRAPFGPCIRCGDCATGCNHGAKNSLDVNLLDEAYGKGAKIYTGATVLRVLRGGPNRPWRLEVVHTDAQLRSRQPLPLKLRARHVILAAGTFGSTEILLRSSGRGLRFSPRLGQRFSANGDTIAALYGHTGEANAVADENSRPADRFVGPTIAGMVTARDSDGCPIVIEEVAIPGPLRRMFEEVVSTANVLHTLDQPDTSSHSETDFVPKTSAAEADPCAIDPKADPCAVDPKAIKNTSIFAMMGNDDAAGAIELIGGDSDSNTGADGDGAVRVRWPEIRKHEVFDTQLGVLKDLAEKSGVKGRVLPNPIWRFVPEDLEELFGSRRGPAFTVHPLGGCTIGKNWDDGVVDEFGCVFRPKNDKRLSGDRDDVWSDLVVLDGSIVPTALATNPALTITALALRALAHLREKWGLTQTKVEKPLIPQRTPFKTPETAPVRSNKFELVERVRGTVMLTADGGPKAYEVELTLRFKAFQLASIIGPFKRALRVNPDGSELKIFGIGKDAKSVTAPLTGSLTVFRHETSEAKQRRCRAIRAWAMNRGVRDTWQWLWNKFSRTATPSVSDLEAAKRRQDAHPLVRWIYQLRDFGNAGRRKWENAKALASRAGEVRLLEYDLQIGEGGALGSLKIDALKAGAVIRGVKRLTYSRRSNPWRQLQTIVLEEFPGFDSAAAVGFDKLTLDLPFFREQNVPLLGVVQQQDQPAALADLFSFLTYVLRLMIQVHIWSFRRPETPDPREPERLPGVLRAGVLLPYKPVITELNVDELPDGTPVRVRLTRYKVRNPKGPPVVLIHGYSASGTTFAHDAVRPNLALHLLRHRRDVWVLDLRTSSGMPTARLPWTFEDAALVDIPAAIAHIVRTTNDENEAAGKTQKDQVDVIAHCMGSAMLSMAVLAQAKVGEKFSRERATLPQWIRRAVLSQVAPIVEFSPANRLRGYVLSYARQFLPLQRYEFRTSPDPSLTDQLIDRLLATLPYPEEEFDLENPMWRWAPWVGTRHRMDALYARDFNLLNIPRRVLKYIDDLFGPLNIETVSQGIHFALHGVITDRGGHNVYVSPEQLRKRWTFPTLSVHGVDNGLADIKTLGYMASGLAAAGVKDFHTRRFPGFGHQDSLIGRDAVMVFETMAQFLRPNGPPKTWDCGVAEDGPKPTDKSEVRMPFIGPHVGPIADGRPDYLPIRAARHPGRERSKCAVVLPVTKNAQRDRFVLWEVDGQPNWAAVPPPDLTTLVDGDGWLQIDVPLKAIEAVDGILVLLVDDPIDLPSSGLPDLDNVRLKLRGNPIPLSLAATSPKDLVQGDSTDSSDLTDSDKQAIIDYFATLKKMLLTALEERTIDDLRAAFIERPKPAQDLCFAFGSCQYPAGILDAVVARRSAERLDELLDDEKRPAEMKRPNFLLLLGDQVYVDATAGLFDPTSVDDRYGRTYERLYSRKVAQSILRQVPSYNMLDDHEIADNWEPSAMDRRPDIELMRARRSYWRYQRFDHFDNAAREFEHDLSLKFKEAKAPFFLLDTRTRRSARTAATIAQAKIVDEATFVNLTKWLEEKNPGQPKFIACPSLPLPRHLRTMVVNADLDPNASSTVDPADDPGTAPAALRSDGWDGYPRSLYRLLGHIARHKIQNVVFLSGDEHLSLVAKATLEGPDGTSVVVHSIHSSALYAPFPFANGDRADFPEHDWFQFKAGSPEEETYTCKVDVIKFARAGDGFAVLSRTAGATELLCEFVNVEHADVEPVKIQLKK